MSVNSFSTVVICFEQLNIRAVEEEVRISEAITVAGNGIKSIGISRHQIKSEKIIVIADFNPPTYERAIYIDYP